MLSVGSRGVEYILWVEQNLGRPDLHIVLSGTPGPTDSLDGLLWIDNPADNMIDVESGSIDLVFAGQILERFWHEQLAGFFVESARILRPGGRLILDGPNREISNRLAWNHPEHTIELTPSEAVDMAGLAGFDVIKSVGHWLCEDPETGAILNLADISHAGKWTAERRILEGLGRPESSFSWWLEAGRSDRLPDIAKLYSYTRHLSKRHFAARIGKMMQSQSPCREQRIDAAWATAPLGWAGAVVFGPHAPLPAGDWMVRFQLDAYTGRASPGTAEVFQTGTHRVLSEIVLPARFDGGWIEVPLSLDATQTGLEFRLWSNGQAALSAMIGAEIVRCGIA